MKFDLDQSTLQIAKGNLIALPDAAGTTIAVLWGSVWLTQDGYSRDYELSTGESLTLCGKGKTVISAFADTAITVLQPCGGTAKSTQSEQLVERARGDRRSNEVNGVRYLSADEMERIKHDAHRLRDLYMASLIYAAGSAVSRGLGKLADLAAGVWLRNVHKQWADSRNRLHLS